MNCLLGGKVGKDKEKVIDIDEEAAQEGRKG
jgi:hypothetical protein